MLCKNCIHYAVCVNHDDYIQCADGCKFFEQDEISYWIEFEGELKCAKCKEASLIETPFCPYCGAIMKRPCDLKIKKEKYSSPDTSDVRFNGEYRNTWNED